MAVIYKATNKINGKIYIGFTINYEERVKQHHKDAFGKKQSKKYFHYALRKHGFDNFEWSILKEDAIPEDEKYFVEELQSYHKTGKGYNLTFGGDTSIGYEHTDETKQKIRDSKLGKKMSDESRLNMSKARKGITQSEELIRKRTESRMKNGKHKHSEETRKKMSESAKKRPLTEERLAILRNNAQNNIGKPRSNDTKAKISNAQKGRDLGEEWRQKVIAGHASKKESGAFYQSEEYREKMSAACKGKKRTPEQRERYRLAALRREESKRNKI